MTTVERTLAVFASDRLDAAAREFLRILAAQVACGQELLLVEIGPGRGVLERDEELGDEAQRTMEGLAAFGIRPRTLDAPSLGGALRACTRLVRVASPGRIGQPALLVLDDAGLDAYEGRDEELLDALVTAGQVIRAPSQRAS